MLPQLPLPIPVVNRSLPGCGANKQQAPPPMVVVAVGVVVVVVSIERRGGRHGGRRHRRPRRGTKEKPEGSKGVDSDKDTLVCRPRPATDTCPPTTTTPPSTTTTMQAGSTTSTVASTTTTAPGSTTTTARVTESDRLLSRLGLLLAADGDDDVDETAAERAAEPRRWRDPERRRTDLETAERRGRLAARDLLVDAHLDPETAAPVVTIAVVIAPGVAVGALEPVRRRRVRPAERPQDGEALGGGGALPREIRCKRRRPARDDRPEDEKETLHLRAFCLRRGLVAGGAAPTFPFASR